MYFRIVNFNGRFLVSLTPHQPMRNFPFWQAGPRFTPGRPLELKMGALAMWLYHRLSSQTNTLTQEHHARSHAAGHLISSMQCNYKSLLCGIDLFIPLQVTSSSLISGTLHSSVTKPQSNESNYPFQSHSITITRPSFS